MTDNPLTSALRQFEVVEANLQKLERLSLELGQLTPGGITFGGDVEYEDRSRSYVAILNALPSIDGWKPESSPPDLDDIAQTRLDAIEAGEPLAQISVEQWLSAPGRELREYRFRLNTKRRALIRDSLGEIMVAVDADIRELKRKTGDEEGRSKLPDDDWTALREHVDQIDALLGSSVKRPTRWSDLARHMHFAMAGDLDDIERMDWPQVKDALRNGLYGENDPIPAEVGDLSDLVNAKPRGPVTTRLSWQRLDDEKFERLIYNLINNEEGYENADWLMQTRAPDKGRDLSVYRVRTDPLAGVQRERVVIQCKHWLSRSVSMADLATVKEQMALWSNPPVEVLVIATSGRFTADALSWVDQHNAKGERPRIELWPESHLETLLAARPALIGEFHLR